MNSRWLGVCLATAAALAAQSAAAQPMSGCPAGQAMQSSDASGRNVACVAIPDVGALQGQIGAEAAARAGMDATLLGAIDDLRTGMNEASIVGRYAFSGNQTCILSSTGFNDDFTPKAATLPNTSAGVSQFSSITTGFRTFHADGTGTAEFFSQSISFPGAFYTSGGFTGVTSNGPGPDGITRPGGGASTSVQTGNFTWQVTPDGKLIIEDDGGAPGIIRSGGNRVGWSVRTVGVPRAVGILGKDLRTISITHEDIGIEIGILTSPDGTQVIHSPRICNRERILRKL